MFLADLKMNLKNQIDYDDDINGCSGGYNHDDDDQLVRVKLITLYSMCQA